MPAEVAVGGYKQLTRVEQAFRCLRSVDLKVRPIHHRAERRVRAHLFVCMLAYYVEWHLRSALAPLLFQHEDLEGWQAERDPVAAAEPPQELQRKKNRRRSEDGLPLHSFSSLLQELANAQPPPVPDAERSQGTATDPGDGSHSAAEASHGTVASRSQWTTLRIRPKRLCNQILPTWSPGELRAKQQSVNSEGALGVRFM